MSVTYQDDRIGFDVRARYVGGGLYDPTLSTLVNNKIDARTYVDLGLQVKVAGRLTVYGNIDNLFYVAPPISPGSQGIYDVVGTYFTFGAKISL